MNDEMRRRSWAGGGKEQGAGSEGAIGPSFSRHGESVQRRTRRIRVAAATGSVNCCRLDVKRRGQILTPKVFASGLLTFGRVQRVASYSPRRIRPLAD